MSKGRNRKGSRAFAKFLLEAQLSSFLYLNKMWRLATSGLKASEVAKLSKRNRRLAAFAGWVQDPAFCFGIFVVILFCFHNLSGICPGPQLHPVIQQ